MNKKILTAFAIIASALMLMTTCIARPVNENTSLETLKEAEQELKSEIQALIRDIENDKAITKITNQIEKTDDIDEKLNILEQYLNSEYKDGLEGISKQSQELEDLINKYIEENPETGENEIGAALPLCAGIYGADTQMSVSTFASYCDVTIDSSIEYDYNDDSPQPTILVTLIILWWIIWYITRLIK